MANHQTDHDLIDMLLDDLVEEYRGDDRQLADAIRHIADGKQDQRRGLIYGRYALRHAAYDQDAERDCILPPDIEPVVAEMRQLHERVLCEANGNPCIPETFEADFASRVCARANSLTDLEAGVFFGLTDVRPESLERNRAEAADAIKEAHDLLYGPPADHL